MKKLIYEIILLAFTLTFLTKESGAQTVIYKNKMRKEVQIIYDFNSKGIPDTIWQIRTNQKGDTISYKKVSKVWHSRRASLQVRINPYLYDVIVGTRQVTDEGIVDTMAARLFLAALTTLSENKSLLDTTSKILSKKEDPIMPKPVEEVLDTINKIVESPILNASAGEIEKIKNSLSLYDNTTEIADAWNANTIVVSGLKANVDMAFKKQMKRIAKEKQAIQDYKIKEDSFHSKIKLFDDAMNQLQSYYDICESASLRCLKDNASGPEIIKDVRNYVFAETLMDLDTFIVYLPSTLFEYKRQINTAYKEVQTAFSDLRSALISSKYYTNISITFDSTLKNFADTLFVQFNRIQPDVFAKSFSLIIINLQNPASFNHTYPTVLISKDTLIYSIETKPSARFKYLIERFGIKPQNLGKFEYPVPVKGNFKVNFSVGAAFMQNGLRPKEYYYSTPIENLENESDPVSIREKESVNDFLPSIAAYTHGYLKLGGWFTPSITVGLSTNPTDFSNASYFLGGSLICGQQSRLIFTFGIAGSNISVLKGKYDVDKIYTKSDFLNIQEADLTQKAFQSGWFWGVSYNISSNR